MNPDFALLGHPASLEHVAQMLPRLRPDLDAEQMRANQTSLTKTFEWSPSFVTRDELVVPRDGEPLRGRLIISTFLPENTLSPQQLSAANQKTREGLKIAKELGAKIVGLGGFTSIVVGAQAERLPAEFGLAATSGNALTAALAIEQIRAVLYRLDWSLTGYTVAVLGATGDIGRACTLALINLLDAKNILLIARNRAKLEALRAELHEFYAPRAIGAESLNLQTSTDPNDAARAGLIVAATSAATPLLSESDLLPGTILCDISYPNTLAYSQQPRPEILAFQGGLAHAPFELPLAEFTQLPSPNLLHGCFAETIVLALEGRYESYSLGQGNLTLDGLQTIYELARAHNLRPAPLYKANYRITEDDFEAFARYAEALRDDR